MLRSLLTGPALALGLVFLAAVEARAADPIASIPYRISEGGWYIIEAELNGEGPFQLIIDTGATGTLLFDEVAAALGLVPSGGTDTNMIGLVEQRQLPPYRLESLRVGEVEKRNLSIFLWSRLETDPGPDGILGLDFLGDYALRFDHRTRRLDLFPPHAPPAPERGWRRIPVYPNSFGRRLGALIVFEGSLNGQLAEFILDTGSQTSLVNRRFLEALIVGSERGVGFSRRGNSSLSDIFSAETTIVRGEFSRFKAGRASWRKPTFYITDAPIFESLGVSKEPYGIAGANLFHDRSLIIDLRGGEVWVSQ